MSPTTVTLEEAANQFQLWRDNNKNKFASIPIQLKDQVKQLLNSYSVTQIANSLGISRGAIYSIIKKDKNLDKSSCHSLSANSNIEQQQDLNFIPFQLVNSLPATNNTTDLKQINCACHITKQNGITLTIHTPDPIKVINAFLCSN